MLQVLQDNEKGAQIVRSGKKLYALVVVLLHANTHIMNVADRLTDVVCSISDQRRRTKQLGNSEIKQQERNRTARCTSVAVSILMRSCADIWETQMNLPPTYPSGHLFEQEAEKVQKAAWIYKGTAYPDSFSRQKNSPKKAFRIGGIGFLF